MDGKRPPTFHLATRMLTRLAPVLLLAGVFLSSSPASHAAPRVFILGDMEKPTGSQAVENSPDFLKDGMITLHAAGNEVVAFQVIFQAFRDEQGLDLRVGDLKGPSSTLDAASHVSRFLAWYIKAENASYDWFMPGHYGALDWRGLYWPDALIPFDDPYGTGGAPVVDTFAIAPREHRNQAVWIDIFIPGGTPPGRYTATVEALQDGAVIQSLPLSLTVHGFNLPDETHVDAFGELYRENGVMFDSGVKFKQDPEKDWGVYNRYVQMAHAHRFLALHRAENGPLPRQADGSPADRTDQHWSGDWSIYTPYNGKILDGSLFTAAEGYNGPSPSTRPSFFPASFIETFYGASVLTEHLEAHDGHIDPALLATWRDNAAAFWREAQARGWQGTRFFAYIMDEVDGAQDTGAEAGDGLAKATQFHQAMKAIQDALDEGTGGQHHISLLWTSHADPAQWDGTPADLRPVINWWSPNGPALDVDFFRDIAARPGQTVWFYHSGHPAIGNHTINQLGIDLRLWGLLCRRYPMVNGSFWWSMMSFPRKFDDADFIPYNYPTYKFSDTRWGNGVLFYPGSRLTLIGMARNIEGPIPSMRMKAYRRGLQDYEYCRLADAAGKQAEVDALMKALIPTAFSEATQQREPGSWSKQPHDYYAMRARLAELIDDAAKPSGATSGNGQ